MDKKITIFLGADSINMQDYKTKVLSEEMPSYIYTEESGDENALESGTEFENAVWTKYLTEDTVISLTDEAESGTHSTFVVLENKIPATINNENFFLDKIRLYFSEYDWSLILGDEKKLAYITACAKELDLMAQKIQGLYDLIDIDSVAEEYIPYLAYLLGHQVEDFSLSDFNLRELTKNMIDIYAIKGTNLAYEKFFLSTGYDVTIDELWWEGATQAEANSENKELFLKTWDELSDESKTELRRRIRTQDVPYRSQSGIVDVDAFYQLNKSNYLRIDLKKKGTTSTTTESGIDDEGIIRYSYSQDISYARRDENFIFNYDSIKTSINYLNFLNPAHINALHINFIAPMIEDLTLNYLDMTWTTIGINAPHSYATINLSTCDGVISGDEIDFEGTIQDLTIIQNSVIGWHNGQRIFHDNGSGTLIKEDSLEVCGTINYGNGTYTISLTLEELSESGFESGCEEGYITIQYDYTDLYLGKSFTDAGYEDRIVYEESNLIRPIGIINEFTTSYPLKYNMYHNFPIPFKNQKVSYFESGYASGYPDEVIFENINDGRTILSGWEDKETIFYERNPNYSWNWRFESGWESGIEDRYTAEGDREIAYKIYSYDRWLRGTIFNDNVPDRLKYYLDYHYKGDIFGYDDYRFVSKFKYDIDANFDAINKFARDTSTPFFDLMYCFPVIHYTYDTIYEILSYIESGVESGFESGVEYFPEEHPYWETTTINNFEYFKFFNVMDFYTKMHNFEEIYELTFNQNKIPLKEPLTFNALTSYESGVETYYNYVVDGFDLYDESGYDHLLESGDELSPEKIYLQHGYYFLNGNYYETGKDVNESGDDIARPMGPPIEIDVSALADGKYYLQIDESMSIYANSVEDSNMLALYEFNLTDVIIDSYFDANIYQSGYDESGYWDNPPILFNALNESGYDFENSLVGVSAIGTSSPSYSSVKFKTGTINNTNTLYFYPLESLGSFTVDFWSKPGHNSSGTNQIYFFSNGNNKFYLQKTTSNIITIGVRDTFPTRSEYLFNTTTTPWNAGDIVHFRVICNRTTAGDTNKILLYKDGILVPQSSIARNDLWTIQRRYFYLYNGGTNYAYIENLMIFDYAKYDFNDINLPYGAYTNYNKILTVTDIIDRRFLEYSTYGAGNEKYIFDRYPDENKAYFKNLKYNGSIEQYYNKYLPPETLYDTYRSPEGGRLLPQQMILEYLDVTKFAGNELPDYNVATEIFYYESGYDFESGYDYVESGYEYYPHIGPDYSLITEFNELDCLLNGSQASYKLYPIYMSDNSYVQIMAKKNGTYGNDIYLSFKRTDIANNLYTLKIYYRAVNEDNFYLKETFEGINFDQTSPYFIEAIYMSSGNDTLSEYVDFSYYGNVVNEIATMDNDLLIQLSGGTDGDIFSYDDGDTFDYLENIYSSGTIYAGLILRDWVKNYYTRNEGLFIKRDGTYVDNFYDVAHETRLDTIPTPTRTDYLQDELTGNEIYEPVTESGMDTETTEDTFELADVLYVQTTCMTHPMAEGRKEHTTLAFGINVHNRYTT